MSGLSGALQPVPQRGEQCSIAVLLEHLDDDDAASLRAWLDDATVPHQSISDALRRHLGQGPSSHTVGRHRRHHCRCPR